MIQIFTGDNSFEIDRELRQLADNFTGQVERVDGSSLTLAAIPDLLMATTLFADHRLVIIKGLSENSAVWTDFYRWVPRVSDDINLVLVDIKPDKRTVTYKELKKAAEIREFPAWTDRDQSRAAAWLANEAKRRQLTLDTKLARLIVERVGVDQWQLASALDKLSLADTIDRATITAIIDTNPSANVFLLFETALAGRSGEVSDMLRTLELTEDPFRLFALLSSQAVQLAAVWASLSAQDALVSKDFGIHPYVAGKLATQAKGLSRHDIRRIIDAFADTDADLKTSRGEPWTLIERTLVSMRI